MLSSSTRVAFDLMLAGPPGSGRKAKSWRAREVPRRVCDYLGYFDEGDRAGLFAVLIEPQSQSALSDAMEEMLTSPSRRANLADFGRENARLFTWTVCARQSLPFFEDCGGAARI
jgi:glycosyltransferase involved in cell wall biosynthesis